MDLYVVARHKNKFCCPQKFVICIDRIIEDPIHLTRMAENNFKVKCKQSKIHWLHRRIHDFFGSEYPGWSRNIKKHVLIECEVESEDCVEGNHEWKVAIDALECLGKADIDGIWISEVIDEE